MVAEGRRYQVQQVLGRGGFGTVYQAEMVSSGGFAKPVALKVLNPEMGGMAEVAQRLRDEARLLGRLKHPAILRVDDLVLLQGSWTVVMELVAGANLHQVVHGSGPLPLGVAMEIGQAVAGALHAAHDRPGPDGKALCVLHRDIKPSNIQLTALGEIKVLDFGVARASFATRESQTRSLIFGSIGYMAPERLLGEDSHAGDVYALGVVLYEILTGRRLGTACSQAPLQATLVQDALAGLDGPCADPELLALLRESLSFDACARPRASAFQRRCRAIRARHPEPWLGDWADEVLGGLLREGHHAPGPWTGRVLCESPSERVDEPTPWPEPQSWDEGEPDPTPPEISIPDARTRTGPLPRTAADPPEPAENQAPPPTPVPTPTPPPAPAPPPDPAAEEPPADGPTSFARLPLPPDSSPMAAAPLVEPTATLAARPVERAAGESDPPRTRWLLSLGIGLGTSLVVMALGAGLLAAPWLRDPAPPVDPPEALPAAAPASLAPTPAPAQPAAATPSPAVATPTVATPAVTARAPGRAPVARSAGGAPAPAAAAPPAAEPSPWGAIPAAPEPAPVERTTRAAPATITVTGDALGVRLRGDAGEVEPGSVPPGRYLVLARFAGSDALVETIEVEVDPGGKAVVNCESDFERCRVTR